MQPDRRNISSLWTKHLKTDADKKRFTDFVLSSQPVLDRLTTLLLGKIDARDVFKEEDFKDPSWAYAAADRNGYRRAINEIVTILRGIDHNDRHTS